MIPAQTLFAFVASRFSEQIMLESKGRGGTAFPGKAVPRWKHVLESTREWGLFACSGRVW